MQPQIALIVGDFLGYDDVYGALSEHAQSNLREERVSRREQKQERRDPLPFTGDGDSETEGPRPPLAWTLIWGGTYSNLFGSYVPDTIRRWGYIFWDAERLERTGAKELLARQWKEEWKESDPRDEAY